MINSAQYISFNIARRMVTATNSFARFILNLFFFPISKFECLMKKEGKNERKYAPDAKSLHSQPWCWWLLWLWLNKWASELLETHNSTLYELRPAYAVLFRPNILNLQNVYARVAASETHCLWIVNVTHRWRDEWRARAHTLSHPTNVGSLNLIYFHY